jgi:Protein of unknown function (DUF1207)
VSKRISLFVVLAALGCVVSPLRADEQLDELPATMAAAEDGVFEGPGCPDPVYPGQVWQGAVGPGPAAYGEPWTWQLMPEGLIYHSYLAGGKEPRMASVFAYEKNAGWVWDITIGARVGLLRYGTPDAIRPEGWQLDVEGAAFPRLNLEHDADLVDVDFRAGVPLTYGIGPFQAKLAYYHLSSHIGDEFLLQNPGFPRINYSRDVIVLGGSVYPTDNVRLYGEAGWAFATGGGSRPWEFQFGAEYSPLYPLGFRGAPFAAINGRLRQEVSYGGNMIVQAGWQWRSAVGRRLRIGAQYFNGKSDQYQFFRQFEEQIAAAIWYDF